MKFAFENIGLGRSELIMIKREEFSLLSSDGHSVLHCACWLPDGKIYATLQISHGMIEHILRYDEFASFLAAGGFAVFGHDHLGHGGTARAEDQFGIFADNHGAVFVLKDLFKVSKKISKDFPSVPHFILGHSMGSFFLRKYLNVYRSYVDGAIIMGTGDPSRISLFAGRTLAGVIGRWRGMDYRSSLMHRFVLGGYNRHFRPTDTASDWLSRDTQKVRQYTEDPYCKFYFSCGAYQDFLGLILTLKGKKGISSIPRSLPVLFLSGKEDPVGSFGKGVARVYHSWKKSGFQDVSLKLYSGARHEILNEINRKTVYEDILAWLELHI